MNLGEIVGDIFSKTKETYDTLPENGKTAAKGTGVALAGYVATAILLPVPAILGGIAAGGIYAYKKLKE